MLNKNLSDFSVNLLYFDNLSNNMPYSLDLVKKLENESNEERKNTIIRILKNRKIKYGIENYNFNGINGSNIIVEFGKGKKYSIASAHYDVIPRSPGANDDGSAIAVLFKLIDNLRKIKLKNKIKISIFILHMLKSFFHYRHYSFNFILEHPAKFCKVPLHVLVHILP